MTQERRKITVTEVYEVKAVGDKGAKKLPFKAKDGENTLQFFTFEQTAFPLIKIGAVLDADIDTSSREHEGNTYTDRKIVQVYVDGKPVVVKGGFGGPRGKSPEERQEIIRQTALKAAVEMVIAGKVPDTKLWEAAEKFATWINTPPKKSVAEEFEKL